MGDYIDDWDTKLNAIVKSIGTLRAEQHSESQIYSLFVEPRYFPQLIGPRPCFVEGARGTGKTTLLRVLSYTGQDSLDNRPIAERDYFGVYLKLESNVVQQFAGPEISDREWSRLFGHFINSSICRAFANLVEWLESRGMNITMSSADVSGFERSLSGPRYQSAGSPEEPLSAKLKTCCANAIASTQEYVNNIGFEPRPFVSALGEPVSFLVSGISSNQHFFDRLFFVLLDEYENLDIYQQVVVNTLIKSSTHPLSYKVALKQNGIKSAATLTSREKLQTPADYHLVDIGSALSASGFESFGRSVIKTRTKSEVVLERYSANPARFLPPLSADSEARLLGGEKQVREKSQGLPTDVADYFRGLSLSQKVTLLFWAESRSDPLERVVLDFKADPERWSSRLNNYKVPALYTLHSGRGTFGTKKYYTGWETLLRIADGNIRLFLMLNEAILTQAVYEDKDDFLSRPFSPESQTEGFRSVARSQLAEIRKLRVVGLPELVRHLGLMFQVFAADPRGHTPEVTQFHLRSDGTPLVDADEVWDKVESLLDAGVMYSALRAWPTTKAQVGTEELKSDYGLHPSLVAHFTYSVRRKRKVGLDISEILALSSKEPRVWRSALEKILARNGRGPLTAGSDAQATLFGEEFLDG